MEFPQPSAPWPAFNFGRRSSFGALGSLRLVASGAVLIAAMALAACSRPVPVVQDVRPVRAMVLTPANVDVVAEFPGEIRPRYESRLGFRIGGKIVARKVDVGSTVRRGQVLMQLDPVDQQLLQAQGKANLAAAESNLALAKSDLARYQNLKQKNFVSPAVLETKEAAFKAAAANEEQARAAWRNQSNQAGYATLVSDADGVVTAIDAEAGQVVTAGTPVIRVARTDEKEIVISIPEDRVNSLRQPPALRVRLWANPGQVMTGKLRELSPVADPATRTYTARISLPDAPPTVQLGMSGSVDFVGSSGRPMLRVPLSALLQEKGATAVWVVENGAVRLVPVQLESASGNDIVVGAGLKGGETVVTAGVHLLKPGQKVKILGEELAAVDQGADKPAAVTPAPAAPNSATTGATTTGGGASGAAAPGAAAPGAAK
ncbi:MAG: efflux transporter periplasmic adaptor subunit [Herminiimonas sp.]|nr:efflux transporter periplasmic adaptor subunit [Herminiimonas sp.]